MTGRKRSPDQAGISPGDPRLHLKVTRLREARETIELLLSREPRLEDPEFEEWEQNVEALLQEVFGPAGYLLRFRQLNIRPIVYSMGGGRRWFKDANLAWQTGLPQARKVLGEAIEEAELMAGVTASTPRVSATTRSHSNKVFVVHGRDEAARETVARFLERLEIDAIVLHEKPSEGRTLVEKLEHYADVDFAVVLLTPDDLGTDANRRDSLQPRARQNVVLELGYFVGKLGRSKVCALYKGPLELPSDYLGVVYVSLDEAGGWRLELAKELKSDGFTVDMNRAL